VNQPPATKGCEKLDLLLGLGLGLGFLDTNLLPCGHQKSDILTLIYVAPSKSKDGKKNFCELQ